MSTDLNVAESVPPLTFLYVPGDRPDRVQKALASEADVVIIDLEDAVSASSKDRARAATAELLDSPVLKPVLVRINDLRSGWASADLDRIVGVANLTGLKVPKVTSPNELTRLTERTATLGLEVHCLIESASGIENVAAIARAPGVTAIGLGEADLRTDLSVVDDAGLAWVRSRVVVAARAAGLPRPLQSVYTRLGDDEGLAASCDLGRKLGFVGRSAIHPQQLPVIVNAYRPTEREVEMAAEIVEQAERATDRGVGALILDDGRFVDLAVIADARQKIRRAERYGTRC